MKNKIPFFCWILLIPILLSLLLPAWNKFDTPVSLYLPFIALGCVLLISVFDAFFHKERSSLVNGILSGLGLIFALWVTLSFFLSQTKNVGYGEVLMTWTCVLLFMLGPHFWNKRLLLAGGIALLSLSSLSGLFLYLTSPHQRLFGLFFNPSTHTDAWPNAFALLFLLLWPLFLLWKPFRNYLKVLKVLLLASSIAALICSFSRAAIGVFFLQMFLMFLFLIFHERKNGKTLRWFAAKIAVAGGIALCSLMIVIATLFVRHEIFHRPTPFFVDKIYFAKGEEVTSVQERLHFWQGSLNLIAQRPLFGFGPMSFGYVFSTIQPGWLEISDHPHNQFLKLGVESGIPAALALLFLLLILFIRTVQQWGEFDPGKQFFSSILWLSVGGALLHNAVDFNFNFINTALSFWLFLLGIKHLCSAPAENPRRGRHGFQIAAMVSASMFALLAFYPYLLTRIGGKNFPLEQRIFIPRFALLEEGDRQRETGNFTEARRFYELQIQKNPFDATGYSRMGELLMSVDQAGEALPFFKQALQLDARNQWVHYKNYVQALTVLGKGDDILAFSPNFLRETKLYLPRLQANLHYTAQKPDVQNLLELLILMRNFDPERAESYGTLENEIRKALAKFGKT